MYLVVAALALAHPGSLSGSGGTPVPTIGQRVALRIAGDSVELEYVAEVPEFEVYRDAKATGSQKDYATRWLRDLADGVTLLWEGRPLTTEAGPTDARAGDRGYVAFTVIERATLPAAAGTLGVRNGNFPDEDCYFAAEATVPGDVVVVATSLVQARDGRLRENRHGAWTKEEALREVSITLRPAAFWEEGEAGALPTRMVGIVPDHVPYWMLALSFVPIALLGRGLGRLVRARR